MVCTQTYLLYFHGFRDNIVFQNSILVRRKNFTFQRTYFNRLVKLSVVIFIIESSKRLWLNYLKPISYSVHKNKLAMHQTNVVFKLIERHFRIGPTVTFKCNISTDKCTDIAETNKCDVFDASKIIISPPNACNIQFRSLCTARLNA